MHVRRRDFLVGCGQAAAAALLPAPGVAENEALKYHLHPHYREPSSLESVLRKRVASLDDFPTEKYHDRIAAVLADWTNGLLQSPPTTQQIESVLAADFRGSSLQPSETKILRSAPELSVRQLRFAGDPALGRDAFLRDLYVYLQDLSHIVTAEFQVTRIVEAAGGLLQTEVRYELVGAGVNFYREGRVGIWELEWQSLPSGEYRLREWQQKDESRSHSARPAYEDRTVHAFAHNHCYSAQLVHGADYWRTVLDGACRIDIYGHNGVSVGDIDGDGWDDLYICQPAGLPNRLFRNHRDGTFEDITELSGLGILENTACAIFADFDNDGRQDLIVVRADGPVLFFNQGGGKFLEQPDAFQFANAPQGTFTGAAAADYDRDGWLDIYFCLYVYYQGTDQYKYPTPYYDANNGPPNFLMRNNRNGTFRDATDETGLNRSNTRYSFCCGWTDFNGNGWPDLYVVNDFGRKNFFRNNGDGTFTDIAAQAGVEDVGAGMSVCCFDYDNDGAEDLYVADMWTAAGERITAQQTFRKEAPPEVRTLYRKHAMGNSLFRNKGSDLFEDQTAAAGVGMGRWSWSSDAWDFDHDGFLDLYVTNGMVSGPLQDDLNSLFWRQVVASSPDEAKPSHDYEQGWNAVNELLRADYSWSGFERNVFYANNRDGTFSDVSAAVGLDFLEDGRSFALADFDRDGRLEVLLKNRNGPQLRLLKNVIEDLPSSICFRLRGTRSNRDAIGAVVTIETTAGRQTRTLQAGSGFLSQHSKEIFFGLGKATGAIKVSIRWPSGVSQSLDNVPPNCRISVQEGTAGYHAEPFHRPSDLPVTPLRQQVEALPSSAETWLLAPVSAPDFSLRATDGTEWTLSTLRGKPVLLYLWTTESKLCYDELTAFGRRHKTWARAGLQLLTLNFDQAVNPEKMAALSFPVLIPADDTGAIYNLLYRSLFDRHRDLSFPTALLIDEQGDVVKIYQGALNPDHVGNDFRAIPRSAAERLSKALPFPTNTKNFAFGRNYLSLGSVYFQRGYFDQAETWFRLAISDDAASAEAKYGLGSVYLKQSKPAEARAAFEKTVKLNASYPDTKPNAWNNLGLLATQTGRTDEAIGYFAEALRLDPEHLISLKNLGNAYRQEKRWADARRALEQAVRIGPTDPEANYSLAMVFAQTDDPESAYTYLRRALQLRPVYPEAMNNLGVLYLRTRRRDEAVSEFEKCIQVAPAFDQSYLNLARVYMIEGNREKARKTLLALLQQHPNDPQAGRALDELK